MRWSVQILGWVSTLVLVGRPNTPVIAQVFPPIFQIQRAEQLLSQGAAEFDASRFQAALNSWEQALRLYRSVGAHRGEALALTNIGNIHEILGQYQKAIALHQRSLDISRAIGDLSVEVNALGNLSIVYQSLGQYQHSLSLSQKQLHLAQEIGDIKSEGIALGALGIAHHALGQFHQAIDFYEQSVHIKRSIGDHRGESASLNNLGIIYDELGRYQDATQSLRRSLSISREIGDLYGELHSLGSLGNVYNSKREYLRAIDFYNQSLSIARTIGNRRGESTALGNLGRTYSSLGKHQQAIAFTQASIGIDREIGDRGGEGASLGILGNIYIKINEYQLAIETYKQSLSIYEEIGDQWNETTSLSNLGAAFLDTMNFKDAEKKLIEGIEIFESIWAYLDIESTYRISSFSTQFHMYKLLQEAQISQGKLLQGLETSERGRSRTFLNLLNRNLNSAESDLQLLIPPDISQIRRIAQAQDTTLIEYSTIYNNFDLDESPGAESIREAALYIWVITPTGQVTFRQVDLTPLWRNQNTDLGQLVKMSRRAIGVRSIRTDASPDLRPDVISRRQTETDQKLRQLHQVLIDPIADLLPTNSEAKVAFIPQGVLFLVPFPALKDVDGKYLIEKHTILTTPSIQTLQLTREAKAQNTGKLGNPLLVGNPTMPAVTFLTEEGFEDEQLTSLPGAQQEAQAISDFLETPALIGSSATEATVKQQIETANIIHFATHGLLEYGDPLQTGSRDVPGAIALTPGGGEDGLLTSSEILDMNLSADLVVLSACDTGRGRITGDGVIGLSRSFISAGVPSVIVSLWQVPDAPTAELMTEFYRQREQTGDNAQALRQAMLSTMQTHPDPKNWAAFTLIGESQ